MKWLIWILVFLLCLFLLPIRFSVAEAPQPPKRPEIREYAENLVNTTFKGGWSEFEAIINKESKWDPVAQNATTTAYGIGQFLNSTWRIVGCKKTADPYMQIDCMVKYVQNIYGTPSRALKHHLKYNWY